MVFRRNSVQKNTFIIISLFLVITALCFAQGMSIDDLVWLKNSGIKEQEILQEIESNKIKFKLTIQDVNKLKKAGFSNDFIAQLGPLPLENNISVSNILKMLKAGKSEEVILIKIFSTTKKIKISIRDRLTLKRAGASNRIIRALAETNILNYDKIKFWYEQNISEDEILQKIRKYPIKQKFSIKHLLALRKLNVSRRILAALKSNNSSSKPVYNETPVVHSQYKKYKDLTGLFSLKYPKSWRIMQEVKGGSDFRLCFTPDKYTKEIKNIKLGVSVHVAMLEHGSSYDFLSVENVFKKMLPTHLKHNKEYKLRYNSHKNIQIGKLKAVEVDYSAVMENTPVKEMTIMSYKRGVEFTINFTVPKDKAYNYQSVFHKIKDSLKLVPGKLKSERLPDRMKSSDIIRRAKQSTVLVSAWFGKSKGTGTGFLVTPNGYIITNHHVCYNHKDKMKQATRIEVSWDSKLGKKSMPAKLIAAWYQKAPTRKDVALLKIDVVNHPYLPLASPDKVLESDRVIAFGFPRTDIFGSNDITITEGTVIRIEEAAGGKLNVISIDAKITHGNSGGPCFDLNLGGVIGINTAVYKGELLGYNIALPITIAFEEFPELYYPQKDLYAFSPTERMKLAVYFKGCKQYRGATRELLNIVKQQGTNDLAHSLLGQVLLSESYNRTGKEKKLLKAQAISYYKKALKINPKSELALYGLGNYYWEKQNQLEAFRFYDRLVSYYPESVWAYNSRALLYSQAKRYEEAIEDAKKAIQLNNDLQPDPYMTLGSIYYKQKKYYQGRSQYKKAIEINPNNLKAQYGRVDYYLYRQDYNGAEIEYARLIERFRGIPEVLEKVGNFYKTYKKDLTKASNYYEQAFKVYTQKGQLPSLTLLRNITDLAYKTKQYTKALERANLRLLLEKTKFQQHDAMIVIGNIFWRLKRGGIGDAFYYLALSKYPSDSKLISYLKKNKTKALDLKSLALITKIYGRRHLLTLLQLILVADLDYSIKGQTTTNLQKAFPKSVVAAIQLRAKRNWVPIRPKSLLGSQKNYKKPTPKYTTPKHTTPKYGTYTAAALQRNIKLAISKFYKSGSSWYVNYTLRNNNPVTIGGFAFTVYLKDKRKKVIKTIYLTSKNKAIPRQTLNFKKVYLVPYWSYSNARFIEVKLRKVKQVQ